MAFELGLGRVRVLSRLGRLDAADRWQAGSHGPDSPMAKQAPAHCGTCGFFLPLAGSLQAGFGVCGNEVTEADGQVVSVEFGCGAHSEAVVEPVADEPGEIFEDDLIDLEPREPTDLEPREPTDFEPRESDASAQPAADLGDQGLVDGEPVAVEGVDGGDSANAGQAEHQPGAADLAERDGS